jgi:hypothetical protein
MADAAKYFARHATQYRRARARRAEMHADRFLFEGRSAMTARPANEIAHL